MNSIKKIIENLILKSPYYNLIRFNFFTDSIIETTGKKTAKGIHFHSLFLDKYGNNQLIFDIGANKGNKVKVFREMGYKVVAVEPEHTALSTLKYRFSKDKNVIIVNKGISDEDGTLKIYITANRSGLNTLNARWVESLTDEKDNRWHKKHKFKKSYDVQVTTLEHLIQEFGIPYYIKIDVEGFELNVIKGLRSVPHFISFESNLPEFQQETIEIIQRLSHLSAMTRFQYSVDDDGLISDKWLTAEEIVDIVNSTNHRYLEVICKLK